MATPKEAATQELTALKREFAIKIGVARLSKEHGIDEGTGELQRELITLEARIESLTEWMLGCEKNPENVVRAQDMEDIGSNPGRQKALEALLEGDLRIADQYLGGLVERQGQEPRATRRSSTVNYPCTYGDDVRGSCSCEQTCEVQEMQQEKELWEAEGCLSPEEQRNRDWASKNEAWERHFIWNLRWKLKYYQEDLDYYKRDVDKRMLRWLKELAGLAKAKVKAVDVEDEGPTVSSVRQYQLLIWHIKYYCWLLKWKMNNSMDHVHVDVDAHVLDSVESLLSWAKHGVPGDSGGNLNVLWEHLQLNVPSLEDMCYSCFQSREHCLMETWGSNPRAGKCWTQQ